MNAATSIFSFLIAAATVAVGMHTDIAADPSMPTGFLGWLMAAAIFGYGYFSFNVKKYGASKVNLLTSIFGILVGACLTLAPVLQGGHLTAQAVIMGIVSAAVGFFTHNSPAQGVIDSELAKRPINLPIALLFILGGIAATAILRVADRFLHLLG